MNFARTAAYALLGALALVSGACATPEEVPAPESAEAGPSVASEDSPSASAAVPVPGAPPTFADLVAQVQPGVVNIYTAQVERRSRLVQPHPYLPPRRVPDHRVNRSLGSGFIVSGEGHILTNSHVIADALAIRVVLSDGRERPAQVVGVDRLTDIALLRTVPFEDVEPLSLGDSDALRVGDWTVAFGNPFGLASTVTAGILSARGRRDVPTGGLVRYVDFLQTDASINPGNSGGPLVNLQGEVIGINTAINAEGQGIAFAIPSNMVKQVWPQLREHGRVSRSWLGVSLDALDPAMALAAGLDEPSGALVTRVVPGGPAQRAGLRRGDVIVSFDGSQVASAEALKWRAAEAGVGAEVSVRVLRAGRASSHVVVMGELPE